MAAELDALGIKIMVSVWPLAQTESHNFASLLENNWLVEVST